MIKEIDDLISFLFDKRPDVRLKAEEIVEGLTGTADGIATLVGRKEKLIPQLLHLMGRTGSEGNTATSSLVNLTALPELATLAVEHGAVERAMDFLRQDDSQKDILIMLLANLTSTEGGLTVLSQEGQPHEGYYITKLVQMLIGGKPSQLYDHCASILTNATRHPIGRKVFSDPNLGLVHAVLPFLAKSASETRRIGIAAAIRNCCIEDSFRIALLSSRETCTAVFPAAISDVPEQADIESSEAASDFQATKAGKEIVRHILRPISGIKTAVEQCEAVRQSCAEAVAFLAQNVHGRSVLMSCEAPLVLRSGYIEENHKDTQTAMEDAARLFLLHGMVPADTQLPSGLHRAEKVCE
jgi:hypothetical protein